MPYFSILIPCLNAAATLGETLDSLLAQTDADWEALIVDDGSSDGSWSLAIAYARRDRRIRVMRNPGQGPSTARNLAMSLAEGEVVAFCDADDLWDRAKLACMRAVFADRHVDAAYAQIAFFDARGSRTLSTVPKGALTVPQLMGENPVCTMSNLCVRTRVLTATGGFDPAMVHNEDLEWLIRLAGLGHRVIGLDRLLVHYRTSPTGLSADLEKMRLGREAALATAAQLGFRPDARAEAIHLRYLARRALRTDAPAREALRLALRGACLSPPGFFSDLKRGGLTFACAAAAPLMPRTLRRALFSH
ncbi:glycosyltransferase family 2 protein [Pseudooceanicola nanhaiensis]|uniref:glycosyltransferase family 2 protein n=1 Tax=Pseudooceanicola nanhaiensis TaxID=375761 RepID=UPI001CD683B0|nr:glycosyltransferase family A protein [Pseudooceanicola nanhaiensis]MCA0919810.1 glycosyltransferase family 2 protein [Pseudooceanicola nanhaiensis]